MNNLPLAWEERHDCHRLFEDVENMMRGGRAQSESVITVETLRKNLSPIIMDFLNELDTFRKDAVQFFRPDGLEVTHLGHFAPRSPPAPASEPVSSTDQQPQEKLDSETAAMVQQLNTLDAEPEPSPLEGGLKDQSFPPRELSRSRPKPGRPPIEQLDEERARRLEGEIRAARTRIEDVFPAAALKFVQIVSELPEVSGPPSKWCCKLLGLINWHFTLFEPWDVVREAVSNDKIRACVAELRSAMAKIYPDINPSRLCDAHIPLLDTAGFAMDVEEALVNATANEVGKDKQAQLRTLADDLKEELDQDTVKFLDAVKQLDGLKKRLAFQARSWDLGFRIVHHEINNYGFPKTDDLDRMIRDQARWYLEKVFVPYHRARLSDLRHHVKEVLADFQYNLQWELVDLQDLCPRDLAISQTLARDVNGLLDMLGAGLACQKEGCDGIGRLRVVSTASTPEGIVQLEHRADGKQVRHGGTVAFQTLKVKDITEHANTDASK